MGLLLHFWNDITISRLNINPQLSFKFVSAPLGATHDTSATRPTTTRRAPRPRHAHRPLAAPAGINTRGRVRGGIFFPGRRCRVVVGGAFRTFRNYLKCRNQPKIRSAPSCLGKMYKSG